MKKKLEAFRIQKEEEARKKAEIEDSGLTKKDGITPLNANTVDHTANIVDFNGNAIE